MGKSEQHCPRRSTPTLFNPCIILLYYTSRVAHVVLTVRREHCKHRTQLETSVVRGHAAPISYVYTIRLLCCIVPPAPFVDLFSSPAPTPPDAAVVQKFGAGGPAYYSRTQVAAVSDDVSFSDISLRFFKRITISFYYSTNYNSM